MGLQHILQKLVRSVHRMQVDPKRMYDGNGGLGYVSTFRHTLSTRVGPLTNHVAASSFFLNPACAMRACFCGSLDCLFVAFGDCRPWMTHIVFVAGITLMPFDLMFEAAACTTFQAFDKWNPQGCLVDLTMTTAWGEAPAPVRMFCQGSLLHQTV